MLSGHELAMALRTAYLTMHRRAQADLARVGLTVDQYVLLSVLAKKDAVTQQELTRRVSSDPNTVRSMLTLLERGGLVRRAAHPSDGRARCVHLTSAGHEIQAGIQAAMGPLQDKLLSDFAPEEAELLLDLLSRIPLALGKPGNRRRKTKLAVVSAQRS